MSFILDALKKLEQKRKHGSVPDLMTMHTAETQIARKRHIWPYILVVGLLLNAGILTAWLRPWESEKQALIAQGTEVQQSESPAVKSEQAIADTALTVSAPSTENKNADAGDIKKTGNLLSPKPDTEPVSQDEKPVKTVTRSKPSQAEAEPEEIINDDTPLADDTLASLDLNPSPEEIELLRNKINEERSSVTSSLPGEDIPHDVKTKPEQNVLELSQLPSEIRKELPDITIKGHIYSNDPRSRIVNVNGHVIKEGDTVISGLKVEEITLSGVIFDYKGIRFRMRAF